jgi:creatinine amidohydrolase
MEEIVRQDAKEERHRLEFLLPRDIREQLVERPIVYLPLGTIEWHCEHLPVGLDALTAHGVCLGSAVEDGGIVYPPLYYGTGGGHGHYPWTIMMPGEAEIEAQIVLTLERLSTFGVKLAVLFSGHFAPTQLGMIDRIADSWNSVGSSLKVLATAVNRIEGLPLDPDHAGIFETTLLASLWPKLAQLDRLPTLKAAPLRADENNFADARHDPAHPIWGVFGPDPRHFRPEQAKPLLDASVEWLTMQVRVALPR